MARTVHMFPGQGDFPVREFTAALARDEALRAAAEATFAAVDRDHTRRGVPALRPWLLGPNPPGARELAAAPMGTGQLALFGASMSVHTALVHRYGPPDAVLGVSFGEIAALTAAGALTVREGAGLAHVLARVLATAPGGLTLMACDEVTAAVLIAPTDTGALVVACVNHPEETVVAGPLRELARLEARAAAAGIAAVRLRPPSSVHHPALTAQADRFHAAVRARLPRPPLLPVLSAVAGRAYRPGEDLPRRLADCLVRPAHLPAVLRLARATGHDTFREAGPGTTLTRAARRVLPEDTTVYEGLGAAPAKVKAPGRAPTEHGSGGRPGETAGTATAPMGAGPASAGGPADGGARRVRTGEAGGAPGGVPAVAAPGRTPVTEAPTGSGAPVAGEAHTASRPALSERVCTAPCLVGPPEADAVPRPARARDARTGPGRAAGTGAQAGTNTAGSGSGSGVGVGVDVSSGSGSGSGSGRGSRSSALGSGLGSGSGSGSGSSSGPGHRTGPRPGSGPGSGRGPAPGGPSGEASSAFGLPGEGPVDGPASGGPSGVRPLPLVRPPRATTNLPLLPERR
ncbi:acyltransferase domain-containing protein [Streptomyces sp. NPDC094049]|uniref:acyltransferase domain-containing protein n=1 Tax=Streptomyces sp. NPDC094049 TaxID=3154987 RepID=UPI003320F623